MLAVSVAPTFVEPRIVGRMLFRGACWVVVVVVDAWTAAVAFDARVWVPRLFEAVTWTRSGRPTSVLDGM